MSDWQFSNPFYEEGYFAAQHGLQLAECPYNYLKFDEDEKIQTEWYRQTEWYCGYRAFNEGK